jgi:hypothetical protein
LISLSFITSKDRARRHLDGEESLVRREIAIELEKPTEVSDDRLAQRTNV